MDNRYEFIDSSGNSLQALITLQKAASLKETEAESRYREALAKLAPLRQAVEDAFDEKVRISAKLNRWWNEFRKPKTRSAPLVQRTQCGYSTS